MPRYEGKVVALICAGNDDDRAIAVALAEAGADLAIATLHPTQREEFATASIANEVWAIGRRQFSYVLDAREAAAVAAFAQLVVGRLGGCDELIVSPSAEDEGDEIAGAFTQTPGIAIPTLILDAPGAGGFTAAAFSARLGEGDSDASSTKK